jgi:hypothetical protein
MKMVGCRTNDGAGQCTQSSLDSLSLALQHTDTDGNHNNKQYKALNEIINVSINSCLYVNMMMKSIIMSSKLESQLLEEISTTLCLLLTGYFLLIQITIKEDLLQSLLHIHLLLRIHQLGLVHRLFQVQINNIACGKDVTDVDILDKGAHLFAALGDLLLRHAAGDLEGGPVEAGHETVGVPLVRLALFKGLDDNGFLAGVAA